jgi:hypothetical protein
MRSAVVQEDQALPLSGAAATPSTAPSAGHAQPRGCEVILVANDVGGGSGRGGVVVPNVSVCPGRRYTEVDPGGWARAPPPVGLKPTN